MMAFIDKTYKFIHQKFSACSLQVYFKFALFLTVCGILQLLLISIVTFFHFILGHDLTMIEEWLFYYFWELVIITKLSGAALVFKFINQKNRGRNIYKNFFLNHITLPRREQIIVVFTLFFCLIFLGRPIFSNNSDFHLSSAMSSYFGVIFFYFIDIFVVEMIYDQSLIPPENEEDITFSSFLAPFIFSLLFLFSAKIIYTLSQNYNLFAFFNFFVLSLLSRLKVKNFTGPLIYLILFVGPMSALFGMNAIWQNKNALFVMSFKIYEYNYIILGGIIFIYLSYKKRGHLWQQKN